MLHREMWQWFAYNSKLVDINSASLYFFISEIFYPSRLDPVPTLQWLKGEQESQLPEHSLPPVTRNVQ